MADPRPMRLSEAVVGGIVTIALAVCAGILGYGKLQQQVTDIAAQHVQDSQAQDEKRKLLEVRLQHVEDSENDTHATLAVLKDRSEQQLEAQKRVEDKLDLLLSHHH